MGERQERPTLRIVVYFLYTVLLEILAITLIAVSIFSIVHEPVKKLRIWQQFDPVDNLLPILTSLAGVFTALSPVAGVIGAARKKQTALAVFAGLMTFAAFFWFAIGAWCVSLHGLILKNIELYFKRLERDGGYEYSRTFLIDLSNNMPRINAQYDFHCCQVLTDNTLASCSPECAYEYGLLFKTVIFPVIYTCVFGAGSFCLLSVLSGCLVCCYLDDVRPAF